MIATCLAILRKLANQKAELVCDKDEFLAIPNGGLIVELRSNHERRKNENEPANDQAKTIKLTDFDKIAILDAVKNCPCLYAYGRAVRVGQRNTNKNSCWREIAGRKQVALSSDMSLQLAIFI